MTYGYPGAFLALVSVILPPLLVLVVDGIYREVRPHSWVKGALRGISLAIVAMLINVSWSILNRPHQDLRVLLIAVVAFLLSLTRLDVLLILVLATLLGAVLYR